MNCLHVTLYYAVASAAVGKYKKAVMSKGRRYWVEFGKLSAAQAETKTIGPSNEGERFRNGNVRLTTGEIGTEVKWTVQSPCTTSLFAVCDWVKAAKGPFILRFFASGWFEEFHDTAAEAANRINDIIARGDRHFTCRTMIKEFELTNAPISPFLKSCISGETNAGDYAVECVFEDTSQQFHVERVGPKSAIGRVYGTFLSSFPCRSTGSYSDIVSQAYATVLETKKPRFDHVLASMKMPDESVFWVPYRRLLLPNSNFGKESSVLVISEISGVEIQLI